MTTNANGMQKETIVAINAWSITELAALDPFVLREMQDAITEAAAFIKSAQSKLSAAVIAKSGLDITQPGTHRTDWCKVTVSKNVSWDQDELDRIATHIREQWGSNASEYINTKMTVSETAYNAWPTEIRELFEPARTIKPSSPKVEFVEAKG